MQRTKRTDVAKDTTVMATDPGTTDDAGAWLRGEGDLLTAAMGRIVPIHVQLGVLAHGSLERLFGLGRYCRRGSVRRTWGTEMASLAGEIARFAGTPEKLAILQSTTLVPLELEVLDGSRHFPNRRAVVDHLRSVLAANADALSANSALI